MKMYKLVKDIPMFKKGDLFFIHPEQGCLVQKDTLRLAYHKETLDKNPEILKDWFEDVQEYVRHRAKYGGEYYFYDDSGRIERTYDYGYVEDDILYNTGNYGLTKEELIVKREYDIARQILLDDAKGGKFMPGNKMFIYFMIVKLKNKVVEETELALDAVNPAVYNPRKISGQQFQSLKKNIKKYGILERLIVNRRTGNTLVSGHQRLKVARELGFETVPVREEEYDEYLKHYPDTEIITIPEGEIENGIADTREWIMRNVNNGNVFFLDDDIGKFYACIQPRPLCQYQIREPRCYSGQ